MAVVRCPKCHDTGWIRPEVPNARGVIPCTCNIRDQETFRLLQARIPKRFFPCRFETYNPTNPSQSEALRKARELVQAFPHADKGLYFFGGTGVGKTHLGVAVLRELARRNATILFVDCNELFLRLKKSYEPDSLETEYGILRPIMETEVVLLDDLGAHRVRDWVFDIYQAIINHRYKEELLTLATTNLPPGIRQESPMDFLPGLLSQRVYSRLFEMCDLVHIEGDDYRTPGAADRAPPSEKKPAPVPPADPASVLPAVDLPSPERSEDS